MAIDDKSKRDADHLWHVWMNRRNSPKIGAKGEFEHSLYEFKNMLQFLEYGHVVIQKAFEGKLPTVHQQCSHVEPVKIEKNVLKCACEGQEVTTCPILLSIKEVFAENHRYDIPVEHLYRTMAKTCAWHSYKISTGIKEGMSKCDLSEGFLLDESDRMFWNTVYENLSDSDEAGEVSE